MKVYLVKWGDLMFMTADEIADAYSKNGNNLGIEVYMLSKLNEWITITITHIEDVYDELQVLETRAEL